MAAGSISSFRARSHESGSSYFQSSVFGGEFHEVKQGEVLAQEPWGRYHQPEDSARKNLTAQVRPQGARASPMVGILVWRQLHTESN
jgi:hypothetical protein